MDFASMLGGQAQPQLSAVAPQPNVNFSQIVPPEQTGLEQSPPKSPEELEQRKAGWQAFMQHIQTDPVARQTLLMVGATMMQDPHPGESGAGVLGRALQVGGLSAQMGRERERRAQIDTEQSQRAGKMNEAQIAQMGLSGDRTRQQMAHEEARQPLEIQNMQLGLQGKEFQVGNQERLLEDQLATSASQREFNRARAARQEAGAVSPKEPKRNEMETYLRQANPEASDTEIAKMMVEHLRKIPKGTDERVARRTQLEKFLATGVGTADQQAAAEAEYLSLSGFAGESEAPEAKTSSDSIDETAFRAAMKKADKDGNFTFNGKKWTIKKEKAK